MCGVHVCVCACMCVRARAHARARASVCVRANVRVHIYRVSQCAEARDCVHRICVNAFDADPCRCVWWV